MAEGVVVREAGPEASEALADLEATAFEVPWSADSVRSLLQDPHTRAWVARVAGRVVGSALIRLVAGEGELLRIAVRPDARGHGIGGALLGVVLSASADACPHGMYLEVRASNVAARRLYGRHGFVDHGRRRDYYQAPREDAVLMQWRPAGHAVSGA
jgi:ribosomal-protein-alanine acetyltransferase